MDEIKIINKYINPYISEVIEDYYKPYPLSYPLNKENCNKFIDACNEDVRYIVKKIINKIKHISFEDFLKRLNKSIKEFHDSIKDDYKNVIIIKKTMFKSSIFWLIKYFINYLEYLKNENLIYIIDYNDEKFLEDIKDKNLFFVYIDDCSYSGSQIEASLKLNIKRFINIFKYVIIIPYICKNALKIIKEVLYHNRYHITSHFYLEENTDDILSITDKLILEKYNKLFDGNNSFDNRYLIYFDHKLPDGLSTIPASFYYGIVLNDFNLLMYGSKIELEQYPLISNCEFLDEIKTKFHSNTLCPHSPYKKGYEEKIREIKENKKSMINK